MTLDQYIPTVPADWTDQQVADGHNALPPVTAGPIPLAALTAYLRKQGLLRRLAAIVGDATRPAAAREGLADFLDHVGDARQANLDATDPEVAATAARVLGYLAHPKGDPPAPDMTAEQVAAVYALGGGLVRPVPTTDADVAAARVRLDRSASIESLWGLAVAEHAAATDLHRARNSKVADLRNDPSLPVPATLAELDATAAGGG